MDDMLPLDGEFPELAAGEGVSDDMAPETPTDVALGLIELIQLPNIVPLIDEREDGEQLLTTIARNVIDECAIDEQSRTDWLDKARDGLELASMIAGEKSTPWEGCANVKYPLIAEAALQFWSRAYPAIVPPGDIVRAKVHGKDRSGKKASRAQRVAAYKSFYLRKKVPEWKSQTSALLMQLPITGHLFRKVWYDPMKRRACVKLCAPDSVIVNNATRHLSEAPRISERLFLTPNEIASRERAQLFSKIDYAGDKGGPRENEKNETDGSGETMADDTLAPKEFIEQHRLIDLDEDGYAEPYIVTVHEKTKKVVRIVANFRAEDVMLAVQGDVVRLDEFMMVRQAVEQQLQAGVLEIGEGMDVPPISIEAEVVSIERRDYFVDYRLFPSFDGSYYGIGLGYLLSHTSEAINSTINRLLDAGTMSNMQSGFIGQGPNMKRANLRFRPGEWKQVNVAGAALRDSIVPLPVKEPSAVLMNLLSFLIESGRRLGNIRDVLEGNTPGGAQMQPTTLIALIQQGMKVFTASIQLIFDSLNREFMLIGETIGAYPDEKHYAEFHDEGEDEPAPAQAARPMPPGAPQAMTPQPGMPPQMAAPQGPQFTMESDFNLSDMDIEPVADPRAVTDIQQMGQAQLLRELAATGDLPRDKVTRRVLDAAGVPGIEELMPEPDPQIQMLMQQKQQLLEQIMQRKAVAEIAKTEADALDKQASAQLKGAQIETERTKQVGNIAAAAENMADAEQAESEALINRAISERDALIAEDERSQRLAMDKLELIDRLLTNDHQRRTAGLAGQPHNGGPSAGVSRPGPGVQGPDLGELLGGGAGPAGPVGGGPFGV